MRAVSVLPTSDGPSRSMDGIGCSPMELNSLKAPTCLRSAFLNGAWPMSLLSKSSRSLSVFSLLRSMRSFAPRSACIVSSAGSPSISDFLISSNNVRMSYS